MLPVRHPRRFRTRTGQLLDAAGFLSNLQAKLQQEYSPAPAVTSLQGAPTAQAYPNPLDVVNDGTAATTAIDDAVRVTSVNREETGGRSESTFAILGRQRPSTARPNFATTCIALDVAVHRQQGGEWVGGVVGYLWNDGTYTNVAGVPSNQVTWVSFSPSQITRVWKNRVQVLPSARATSTGQSIALTDALTNPLANLAALQTKFQQEYRPSPTTLSSRTTIALDGDANTPFPEPRNTNRWPGNPGLQVQANDAARVAANPIATEVGGHPVSSPLTWTRSPDGTTKLPSPVVAYDFVASRPGSAIGTWTGGVVGVLLKDGSYWRFGNKQSDRVAWVLVNTSDILRSWRNGKLQTAILSGHGATTPASFGVAVTQR